MQGSRSVLLVPIWSQESSDAGENPIVLAVFMERPVWERFYNYDRTARWTVRRPMSACVNDCNSDVSPMSGQPTLSCVAMRHSGTTGWPLERSWCVAIEQRSQV